MLGAYDVGTIVQAHHIVRGLGRDHLEYRCDGAAYGLILDALTCFECHERDLQTNPPTVSMAPKAIFNR